jgi:uncharacterized protein (TIGR03435 family)
MIRVIVGAVLGVWLCSLVYGQETKLEFEVASIKPSDMPGGRGVIRVGPQGGPGSGDPGRVNYMFSTIRDLLVNAYDVKRYQISGGPGWVDSERFDIVAKVPEGATREQVRVMLQNLLAERFKLALHRETKELPMYALVVSGKGSRLKPSTATETSSPPPLPPPPGKGGLKIGADGCPEMPPVPSGRAGNFMIMTPSGACMISNGQTLEGLATQLSNQFDRPVIDQTGLKGKYDFKLRYDPASTPGGRGGPMMGAMVKDGGPPDRIVAEGDQPPAIFNALQEQLGLKLEAKKGPVELLVIDHVEKTPTEN